MSAPYPGSDSRRKQDLLLQLQAAAGRFLPAWRGLTEPDDSGHALLQIGADLAEHVTSRLDRTAERDLKAFLNWLDLAGPSATSAEAWLVFTLSDKLEDPLTVRERVQIGAAGPDGEEIIFETPDRTTLTLTPARLAAVFGVDPSSDRIERAPPSFGSLEPERTTDPDFELLSFAAEKSTRLQITPPIGLDKGDWIRIGGAAYEIVEQKDGIYTIEPGLDASALAGTSVTRVTRFVPGTMRNLQRHVLYVGHKELFNLEQRAVIGLHFIPAEAGRFLSSRDIAWELWGTPEGAETSDWRSLEATIGASSVSLRKSWIGKADEREVGGEKSRWLRARLLTPMIEAPSTFARDRIELTVRSDQADKDDPEAPLTVTAGFHNATPLPVSDRFLPFGPEPRLFDQFYLAAPETFSKKGARVTLDVIVGDATIESAVATGDTDGVPANFAVSNNGHLQLIQARGANYRWLDLGHPGAANSAGDGEQLTANVFLDTTKQPAAIPFSKSDDEVRYLVAAIADGLVWTTLATFFINENQASTSPWVRVGTNPLPTTYQDIVALPRVDDDEGTGRMFTVGTSGLRWTSITADRSVDLDTWELLPSTSGSPQWGRNVRLSAVQTSAWPAPPPAQDVYELLLLDESGEPWRGRVQGAEVQWLSLAASGDSIRLDVRPAALRLDDSLYILTATTDGELDIRELNASAITPIGRSVPLAVTEASAISAALQGDAPYIISVVDVEQSNSRSSAVLNGTSIVEFVRSADKAPGTETKTAWLNRKNDGVLSLFVAGTRETACVRDLNLALAREIELLQDVLILEGAAKAAHYALFPDRVEDRLIELEGGAVFDDYDVDVSIYAIDQRHNLREGEPYQFLRRAADPFVGRFDETRPNQLTLHRDDDQLRVDQSVVIDHGLYEIDSIDKKRVPWVATFTTKIDAAGGPLKYVATTALPEEGTVKQEHIGAVGVLDNVPSDDEYVEDGDALLFPIGAIPNRRRIIRFSSGGVDKPRVYMDGNWKPQPDVPVETLVIKPSALADWQTISFARAFQNPELSWEYFDGRGWRRLESAFSDTTGHLVVSGDIQFDVPDDLDVTKIGGKDDYWIRARLIGGDYGQPTFVVDATPIKVDNDPELQNLLFDQKITIDRSALNPPEILSIEASFELNNRINPELTLTDNNLATINQTAAAEAVGAVFDLFAAAASIDPERSQQALYLGLSKAFAADALRLLVNAAEQEGEIPLTWEVFAEGRWQEVPVIGGDPTKGLLRPGIVTLRVDVKPTLQSFFGQSLYWLRAYPDDEANWQPDLAGIYLNTAPAEQAKTLRNELLGSSIGEPNARFRLAEAPVLQDSLVLRVRERLGTEERAALVEAFGEDAVADDIADFPGEWVRWREVESLIDQPPDARIFMLDLRTGLVRFGNDLQGRIPPAGADNLRAFDYRAGGGQGGNVAAHTIISLKSAVTGVEAVTNPLPARGGGDGRDDEGSCDQATATVRHLNRAIASKDIEALALEFAPEIARARCLRPEAFDEPITVVVAVAGDERRVQPSVATRDGLEAFLREKASSSWPEASFDIVGPDSVALRITIVLSLAPDSPATLPLTIHDRLFDWLHPTIGGHHGQGWPFGRGLWPSDVHQALARDLGGASIKVLDIARKDGRGRPEAIGPTAIIAVERDDIGVHLSETER